MPTIDDLPVEIIYMVVEELYHSILDDVVKDRRAMGAIRRFYHETSERAFVRRQAAWKLHYIDMKSVYARWQTILFPKPPKLQKVGKARRVGTIRKVRKVRMIRRM